MPARLSVEVLRPAGASAAPRATRARAPFRGARVRSGPASLVQRGPGGILDQALEGLVARFAPILGMALVFWLPFGQVTELIGLAGATDARKLVISTLWQLTVVVPQAMTVAVVTSLVGEALSAGVPGATSPSVGACILRGLRRAPGVLAILFLCRVLATPLLFLCLAPFFLLQWLCSAAVAVHVLEGQALLTSAERARARSDPLAFLLSFPRRIARALARSWRLAAGWGSLGRWLVLLLVGEFLLAGSLEGTASVLALPQAREVLRQVLHLEGGPAEFLLGAVGAAFLGLGTAIKAAIATAFALDVRVRKEGLDLELRLRAFERAGAAGPEAA
jgi:hypothetical protein